MGDAYSDFIASLQPINPTYTGTQPVITLQPSPNLTPPTLPGGSIWPELVPYTPSTPVYTGPSQIQNKSGQSFNLVLNPQTHLLEPRATIGTSIENWFSKPLFTIGGTGVPTGAVIGAGALVGIVLAMGGKRGRR